MAKKVDEFGFTSGALLGHIVIKDGIIVDPNKIKAIVEVKTPNNAKALSHFFGKIRWQSCMICYSADFATPLDIAVHRTPYRWTTIEDKVYEALKLIQTQALIVQPLDWSKLFQVFVDASEIAIGSALMQLVYYSSRKLAYAECNYSMTEHEALGMIYSVNMFWHYLLGRKNIMFHVDHATLLYLVAKQDH